MKARRYLLTLITTASALMVFTISGTAGAAETTSWNGGDGNWSESTNWDNGVPEAGETVDLKKTGYTVTLDVDTAVIHELYIDGMYLEHDDEHILTLDDAEWNFLSIDNYGVYNFYSGKIVKPGFEVKIGIDGYGDFYQSGGTFEFSGGMYLGDQSTGEGTYTMSGGVITGVEKDENVEKGGIVLGEWGGTGVFIQDGYDSFVDINDLTLARQEDATGYYNFINGMLNADSYISVGKRSTGEFVQGESYEMPAVTTGSLYIGRGEDDSQGDGKYYLYSGTLNVSQDIFIGGENGGTGLFEQVDGEQYVSGNMEITETGQFNLTGSGYLEVAGDIANAGIFNMTGGSVNVSNIQNDGNFDSGGYELNVSGNIVNNGEFYNTLTMESLSFDTFSGTGTVTGILQNASTVSPGNSTGTLTINGYYEQAEDGTLFIELGGYDQGDSYDWLKIIGTEEASLAGTLEVVLWEDFTPKPGDTFDILTALAISGEFDSYILPEGWNWDIDYLTPDETDTGLYTVRLTANAVPIPGALWLLGSGLVGLIGIRRKFIKE